MQGLIVKYDAKRGYGLISFNKSSHHTIFFHVRDMSRDDGPPYIMEYVDFDVVNDFNGCMMAVNIHPVTFRLTG
ncbi:MAG: cold shock domain-containing protein [Vibrio sp.]|nr:cold shock domain-containing protein [Vibrio sp.]